MRVILGMILVTLSACYQLDTSSGKFRCDSPGDVCPSNTTCIAGFCHERRDETAPAPAADMKAAPDLAPQQASGCTTTGVRVAELDGARAFACEGGFGQGGFGALCSAGFHVCASADEPILRSMNQSGRCAASSAFYAALVEAALKDDGEAECRPADTAARRVLLGCGGLGISAQARAVQLKVGCSGLQQALLCDPGGSGWTCTKGLADATHGQGDRGGVLCCESLP